MDINEHFNDSSSDSLFCNEESVSGEELVHMNSSNLFKILMYSKYTSLNRLKLVNNVDENKEFFILQGSNRIIYKLRSEVLNFLRDKGYVSISKSTFMDDFNGLLEIFHKYDDIPTDNPEDPSQSKASSEDYNNITIDYSSLTRIGSNKDIVMNKIDTLDSLPLKRCLNFMKLRYNYDFSMLVSQPNIIYQIFLYNDQELQVMTKDNKELDPSFPTQLRLNNSVPSVHCLYDEIIKHRGEFLKKINCEITCDTHPQGPIVMNSNDTEVDDLDSSKFQSKTILMNSFDELVARIHNTLVKNDILLTIRIVKLNKASVNEASQMITPVLKEILDDIQSFDADYQPWIRLFRQNTSVPEYSSVDYIYRVFNSTLDFSLSHGMYQLTDLVVDLIFSFSIRVPDISYFLQSLIKYFKTVLLPSNLNYITDISRSTSDTYNNIFIPTLPNLDSSLAFEYLSLQSPMIIKSLVPQTRKRSFSTIPKLGTFAIRLDIELLDRIDYNKLYNNNTESFNFKLLLKDDNNSLALRSNGINFFVCDPNPRIFNNGSNFLSLEFLFNNSSVVVFTNGTFFKNVDFQDSSSDFFHLDFFYNVEKINMRQYFTLTPGFRMFLIKSNFIHHHTFLTSDKFITISLGKVIENPCLDSNQLDGSSSDPEMGGYIKKMFEYFSFFSMIFSSVHSTLSNVSFNISFKKSSNPLNLKSFEALGIMFELLLNIFELVSDILNTDLLLISLVPLVNVITIWRLLSESIISLLSVVKMFFSLPINIDDIPLSFLNNLTQILIESIKYRTHFKLDDELTKYHHPIDLISLANSISTISIGILASNSLIFKQLFSTSPIHLLSDILVNIAQTDSYYVSDLSILTKNRTLNALDESLCIEIFTKRALSKPFDNISTEYSEFPSKFSNLWLNIIYDLLETDKLSLKYDNNNPYDFCTCNSSLTNLSLLDPMFDYCIFCLRKYFNYFSSITSLNYHMTKMYKSESFYSIPRPSMLLCHLLLKRGMIIMLFDLYSSKCTPYKYLKNTGLPQLLAENKNSDNDSRNYDLDNSSFEDYYLYLFEPGILRLIESIFVYLLKLKEHILYIIINRIELLSKYLLDYFGLLLHNFISCLSLHDLFSYYYEFMSVSQLSNKYLFNLIIISCINLFPFLIKVLLMYNKILREYSSKYQNFSPFMNYLIFQFSSLLDIFMKLIDLVYQRIDHFDYNFLSNTESCDENDQSDEVSTTDINFLKDPSYILNFPKCITSELNFNFSHMSNNLKPTSESNPTNHQGNNEFEICKSIRRLLILVQDFKYVNGSSVSFRNISEIESFISNTHITHHETFETSNLTNAILNMESWATGLFSDYFHPVHPHLVKIHYTLIALFTHLLSPIKSVEPEIDEKRLNELKYRSNFYSDSTKYANHVCVKILSKLQKINTNKDITDKDAIRELYLDNVRARCLWLIKNSTPCQYYSQINYKSAQTTRLNRSNTNLYEENIFKSTSNMRTTTYNIGDSKTNSQKFNNTLKRSNSTMFLRAENRNAENLINNKWPTNGTTSSKDYISVGQPTPTDRKNYNDLIESIMEDILDFILNGPSEKECQKNFTILRLSSLIRLSLLCSVNALIYSFLDLHYSNGSSGLTNNFAPIVVDLLLNIPKTHFHSQLNEDPGQFNSSKNMNDSLDLFWYIIIQKIRGIVLCTTEDSKFELVNGTKFIPNIYSRVVNEYLSIISENICDWYIRSGVTSIDSTSYTEPNMNLRIGISLSFFSLLYSLGLDPMTDSRYSYQIFNHMFSILHPLPMSNLKKAMSNQTSLSCYTIESALVVYISNSFLLKFGETVENLFNCMKTRKFVMKDHLTLDGGVIYLMLKKSSKLPEMSKQDHLNNLKFTHLWSFPKIELTTHGYGHYLIYNFDSMNSSDLMDSSNLSSYRSNKSVRSDNSFVSMNDNDIILWRMENYSHLITEMSLSKRTSNNLVLNINTSTDISVFLTLVKNIKDRRTNEIQLALVNYLGGSLELEGPNGTWTQVLGLTKFDDLYKMRANLYLLMKYLLWVELGTNVHNSNPKCSSDNVGLVLKILFKYLRSTALQIFNLSSTCNCKEKTENLSIKYYCSNISSWFKYSDDVKGYLVDSDNYTEKPLISRGCSMCSTNLIYKKEMDYFWGNLLSSLIELVRFCYNYDLIYLVLNSLLTTFTLGERQVQAFLSMDYLGQRFCNLLVVAIKQLSTTMPPNSSYGFGQYSKFGINNFNCHKTNLAAPKIHGTFVLKWLPPLKQIPMECIYASLRENFQSILISKPFKLVTKIEPNDPFVTLPHSDHFVTHRTSVDFEADISENTLQVIRANNMGGIVMYRIPSSLGTTSVQLTTNFYILNGSRFGITVAPADCVFGSVPDLFERNDVVGFSNPNSLPFVSQVFAATIGYSIGDVLTSHFTIDHQDDGQLCLRTELLIGGNSIGSVLEVVFDPITQNDPSRRMSLVFIFQDPATLVLQGPGTTGNSPVASNSTTSLNPMAPINESTIINTFLSTNVRRDTESMTNTTDRGTLTNSSTVQPTDLGLISSTNLEVVRALDRIVSRETSGTIRSRSVTEHSIPVSISESTRSIEEEPLNLNLPEESLLQEYSLDDNILMFSYENYFDCKEEYSMPSFDIVPEWDVKYDHVDNEPVEEVPITLCKDEFWDKLLREDKYSCLFAQFSDSVQIYQSVLSVNVPMFSGLKHEIVSKITSSFDDLYDLLTSNIKYSRLELSVRDCLSWLCVLCCDHERDVWDKIATREFKVVSDFALPFLIGSSSPSKTTLVSLSNELLLDLLIRISRILTIRPVYTTLSLCSTKKGCVRFTNGDIQTDSLILAIGSKSLLTSTLILKILSHRSYTVDLHKIETKASEINTSVDFNKVSNDELVELVDGLSNFILYFLSCCSDEVVISTSTIESITFSKLESILQILGVDVTKLNTQATYKTHNNTLHSVELVQLDDLWNTIYNCNLNYDLLQHLIYYISSLHDETGFTPTNVKMFATCDKHIHSTSRIPSFRRHFMRRSQFYKLIEHDIFDLLQSLVSVFNTHFSNKIINRCTTTLGLFRSSLVHFSSTFEPNSIGYWDAAIIDESVYVNQNVRNKMHLFSTACDPLYSWQLLFYNLYQAGSNDQNETLTRILLTELTYCIVLSISCTTFSKFLECVYWILDPLVMHPLCPYNLRRHLTGKPSLNLLHFLFIHGLASPPKLAQVSSRIMNNAIPSFAPADLERFMFLTLYLGTISFMRVHSVCNYYSTSDLDMFTNLDSKRHDHSTRLATANILHSFLTSFVLLTEAVDNIPTLNHCNLFSYNKFSSFFNMGSYLYLARNKKLTRFMLSSLFSLPFQLSTTLIPSNPPLNLNPKNRIQTFTTFGTSPTNEQGLKKFFDASSDKINLSAPNPYNPLSHLSSTSLTTSKLSSELYFISCSTRYYGLILNFKLESPTRLVFSQYRNFSKIFAELVVSPSKTFQIVADALYLLEDYVSNVPFIKYKLKLDPSYTYKIGYTTNPNFVPDDQLYTKDQVFKSVEQVYLSTTASYVEMYIRNDHIFWEFNSTTTSTQLLDTLHLYPYIYTNGLSKNTDAVNPGSISLNFDVIIPVNSCFVKRHENEFGIKKMGNCFVVTPTIRTGLSVHKPKVLFPNISLLDLKSSSLVTHDTDVITNLRTDDTLLFDPCLPFRLSFKFEKGFDSNVRSGFYVGLVSKSEKLLWYSNGDLYISTNFHVPSKTNEYRKTKCISYSESDVISITFDPNNSSLYFTNNNATNKLNFYNYYYHITNVHTNNLINANKDIGHEAEDDAKVEKNSKDTSPSEFTYTYADRRTLINSIIFDDLAKIKTFLDYPCDLFENGCDDHFDLDGDDYYLFSPIYIAANLGRLSLLKLMAMNKNINFDVKSGPFKTTPLMGAVKAGHYDVVYYLLTIHSLDINALDSMGNNCLYYSINKIKFYDFKIVELLLNFGVRVQPSEKSESILDLLSKIPGKTELHTKLIDVYKLQGLVVNDANWPLLQNLNIVMSSKQYVKYNIVIDPPNLSPVNQTKSSGTSPTFLSPDRRMQSSDDDDVFDLMGNFFGKLGEDMKESFTTTMGALSDGIQQQFEALKTQTTKFGFNTFNSNISSTGFPTNLSSISSMNSTTSMNLSSARLDYSSELMNGISSYIIESLEIIRITLFKITNGIDEVNPLIKTVSNELNLPITELIPYYLHKFIKAFDNPLSQDKLTKNFKILTLELTSYLSESEFDPRQMLIRYIKYENELVSFGLIGDSLSFSQRLEKQGNLLKELGIIGAYSQNNGNFVYISTDEDLLNVSGDNKSVSRRNVSDTPEIKAEGNLHVFDLLRTELNKCMTFEIDRCLVSLVDLLRNSNKQLVTLVKIISTSNSSSDVLRHLPPSDSQLWSGVTITVDNIYNNISILRKKILELMKTYPLSHVDKQLLYTVLYKSLIDMDIVKILENDQNSAVESKILSILEKLELAPPSPSHTKGKGTNLDSANINTNYTFDFTDESSSNSTNNQNFLSIRPLSSPHLINRIDTNLNIYPQNSTSRLYFDFLNTIESDVLNLNHATTQDIQATSIEDKTPILQNDQGLETHLNTNCVGSWYDRDPSINYLFHCLSLILLADRLKYFDLLSDIFRNVVPVVSTILNQPKIEYRNLSIVTTPSPKFYYGHDLSIDNKNTFGVCLGPSMPVHFSDYLKNKPLIKKCTLNEMYEKIFSLKTLSVERPYFSIRVDRGIAHTTKSLKNSIWFQSTNQILNCNPNILRAKNNQRPFMVVFKGEGSTDFGGPFQELLTCISNEFMFALSPENDSQSATVRCQNTVNTFGMHQDTVLIKFNHYPIYKLFNSLPDNSVGKNSDELFTLGCCDLGLSCSSGCCFLLSSIPFDEPSKRLDFGSTCNCGASEIYSDVCTQNVPMELAMYESLGRLCAMCVCMMNPLNVAINPIIWKKLLCSNLKIIDLLDCDKISVDLLQRLNALHSTGTVTKDDLDGLVFSLEGNEGCNIDLVVNGSNIPVSPENLDSYLKLSTLFRLTEGDLGCSFFAKGINSVVPIGRLRTLLDPRSLEFVVCGDSLVDLSVLRAHTVSYSINLKRDLFDVLARFNNDMLQLFLRFVSGRSRLPHPNSDWCLRLEYDNKNDSDADSRLPTSATCSFRLLMPKYSSIDIMHKRLIYAIENCIAIDLDAHVVHDEMQLSIN